MNEKMRAEDGNESTNNGNQGQSQPIIRSGERGLTAHSQTYGILPREATIASRQIPHRLALVLVSAILGLGTGM